MSISLTGSKKTGRLKIINVTSSVKSHQELSLKLCLKLKKLLESKKIKKYGKIMVVDLFTATTATTKTKSPVLRLNRL